MYEVLFYDTIDGKCPVQDFLDSLEPKILAKTLRTIDLLETNGPILREPYSKHIQNGLFELRTKQGSDITRIMSGGMAMSNYRAYKEKALQNPEVKTEYDALQAEYDIIQSLNDARANQNITQKELSLKTGIPQADISRIENGTRNPSLSTLKKLAQGLGMQLRLEFIPDSAKKV